MNSCLQTKGLYVRVWLPAQSYELGYDFVMKEHTYPPGHILFNHMAPMAETPHTQNRNGSQVSLKVCSKWLSLHKQCHKHAQRVEVVYSWAAQKSSQSHNASQNTKQTGQCPLQSSINKFLIPHLKPKHHITHSFLRLYDFGTNYRLRLRMPQLYLHLQN